MRTGAAWADPPKRFGKPNSVCRRFRRLAQKKVWEAVFEALKAPELYWVVFDSTVLRAHQHAPGQKKRPRDRLPGPQPRRDEHQNLRLCEVLGLLNGLDTPMVIAVTSYDSDANRAYCAKKGITFIIPNRLNRTEPLPLDADCYRDHNKIEGFFGRIKQFR